METWKMCDAEDCHCVQNYDAEVGSTCENCGIGSMVEICLKSEYDKLQSNLESAESTIQSLVR